MDRDEWQGKTGEAWAAEWKRTDRSFGMVTERLLGCTQGLDFSQALDIGCGAGELSLAIARGRPHAAVTGVDVSPDLIEVARKRGEQLENVRFACADASEWLPEDRAAPDLLVSRHGVMFFADPVAAFTHLHAIAQPQARLLFSCFRNLADNPVFTEVAELLRKPAEAPPPDAPGPFAFADPDRVRGILEEAGWIDIEFEKLDVAMVVGGGSDPVGDAVDYFSHIGPAARALRDFSDEQREVFRSNLRDLASKRAREGIVSLRAGIWIVCANKG